VPPHVGEDRSGSCRSGGFFHGLKLFHLSRHDDLRAANKHVSKAFVMRGLARHFTKNCRINDLPPSDCNIIDSFAVHTLSIN
jgi:hypothetical protein